jgi:hypothetical protein
MTHLRRTDLLIHRSNEYNDFRWHFRRSEGDCVGSRNSILIQRIGRDRIAGGRGLAIGHRPSRVSGRSFLVFDVPFGGPGVWAFFGIYDSPRDGAGRGTRATIS